MSEDLDPTADNAHRDQDDTAQHVGDEELARKMQAEEDHLYHLSLVIDPAVAQVEPQVPSVEVPSEPIQPLLSDAPAVSSRKKLKRRAHRLSKAPVSPATALTKTRDTEVVQRLR